MPENEAGRKPARASHIALLSLLVMTTGFAVTLVVERTVLPDRAWLSLLLAGFEAGLVGGLADWFAVTALFRHPLGLPIPHTAILPANRGRITNALVSMVENDLLDKNSLQQKVRSFHAAEALLRMLRKNLRTPFALAAMRRLLIEGANALDDLDWNALLKTTTGRFLQPNDVARWVRRLGEEGLERKWDGKAVDWLINHVEAMIGRAEFRLEAGELAVQAVKDMPKKGLTSRSLPTLINILGPEKTGTLLQDFLLSALRGLREESNETRVAMMTSIHNAILSLDGTESVSKSIGQALEKLTESDEWLDQLKGGLTKGRLEWERLLVETDILERALLPMLEHRLDVLLANPEAMQSLEEYLNNELAGLVDRHHADIGRLVRENVDRFETDGLVRKIEDRVGNDLQWIRINGAVCGFLAGLMLFGVRTLAGLL